MALTKGVLIEKGWVSIGFDGEAEYFAKESESGEIMYIPVRGEDKFGRIHFIKRNVPRLLTKFVLTANITWYYNKSGHVSIWKGAIESPKEKMDADIYLQTDTEVEVFFEKIGQKIAEVQIGDWDTVQDVGYFD